MNDEQRRNSGKATAPAGRLWRWLRRIGIVLVLLIGIYVLFRLVYPVWINMHLPPDAPRIAFSLDNTLLARIGITDATYQRVVSKAGGRLITLRPDAAGDPEVDPVAVKAILEEKQIDGVLLAGGGDVDPKLYGGDPNLTMLVHRLRDDFEIALIRAAKERGLPMLGICRGCQILNVALGGTVRNLRKDKDVIDRHMVLTGHSVDLIPDSNLAQTLGAGYLAKVVSLHGNSVAEPAVGVRIAATGPGGVVEAIEADSGGQTAWIVGIQWHPEMTIDDEVQHKVYKVLVERARKVRARRLHRRPEVGTSARQQVIPEPRFDRIDYSKPRAYVRLPASIGNAKHIGSIAARLKRQTQETTLRAIHQWMSKNLRYDPNAAYNWRNFDRIIDDGTLGGCADHSIVFGALSRSCGIPTVWVKTMDYDWIRDFKRHGPVGSWRGHVFLEVYIRDGWVLLDAEGMILYEDYDRNSRFFPGRRYAYDKGGDPYELILSVRWSLWKKQTVDYFAKFDVSSLPDFGRGGDESSH